MLDRSMVYEIMYALLARDGREARLFGGNAPLASEAFARSLAGDEFPELWFELPLAGEPWFDLHVLTAQEALTTGMGFPEDATGALPGLFSWFASAPAVRQLALSWDLHSGDIEHPAVQLLVSDADMHVAFLERAGGQRAAAAYSAFRKRLPEGWFACYTGIFPGRPGSSVRVECIPRPEMQQAYAEDASLLEAHLRQAGLADVSASIVERCQLLARMPFQLEFQFDVREDGACGDTFGTSARFDLPGDDGHWASFDIDAEAGELMRHVEDWGLADGRWRELPQTAFAKRVQRAGQSVLAYAYPAFVKLRWRAGDPLDAKTYLIARVE